LTISWPQGHFRLTSSLKNSTFLPHLGHSLLKISPGFQYLISCPGHLIVSLLSNSNLTRFIIAFLDLGQSQIRKPTPRRWNDRGTEKPKMNHEETI
jgi:hypothetical protein